MNVALEKYINDGNCYHFALLLSDKSLNSFACHFEFPLSTTKGNVVHA